MNILPRPQKVTYLGGEIVFADTYKVKNGYEEVNRYIGKFTSFSQDAENEIVFISDEALEREEYILNIDNTITVTSKGAEGAFRASSTLRQLIHMKKAVKQIIHDKPLIKNRGIMLDVSRGRVPKIETLFTLVDLMADLKYNQLQLYMDAIVFEYEHFEEYTKEETPITREELKSLVRYCRERFIELVPNQNSFGHMEKWLKKDKLKPLGIECDGNMQMNTLNPLDSRSVEFIDTLYGDLLPYFNSEYINIGMDETFSLGMGSTRETCEKYGKDKVYLDFLNKIIRLCKEKYNKTPMFWDDMIFKHMGDLKTVEANFEGVDKEAIFMEWGYEQEWPFLTRARFLKEKGVRFYLCPSSACFGSITGRFDNMIYNIENAAHSCVLYGAEGFLLTEWGDSGHAHFMPMSFISYIFGACCSWNYQIGGKEEFAHPAYLKTSSIVRDCEEYADEYIFGGNKVARILHSMGNYYLVENNNLFSTTNTFADAVAKSEGKKILLDSDTYEMVGMYMSWLRNRLDKLSSDTPYLDEIKCNCDTVILFTEFIRSDKGNADLKEKLLALKNEFVGLWNIGNRKVGSEFFVSYIDKMIEWL